MLHVRVNVWFGLLPLVEVLSNRKRVSLGPAVGSRMIIIMLVSRTNYGVLALIFWFLGPNEY